MQISPTLNSIRTVFFAETQKALLDDVKSGKVFIVPPAQDADPALRKILVLASFSPGNVEQQEIGGVGNASGRRQGIWKMTISSLKDVNAGEPWMVADKLENAFAPYSVDFLPVTNFIDDIATEMKILCEFPYSENIGTLPDGRNGITVTVPWWTWVEN